MKSILFLSLLLSTPFAFSEDQDPLGTHLKNVEKKEAEKKFQKLVDKVDAEYLKENDKALDDLIQKLGKQPQAPEKKSKAETAEFVKRLRKELNDPTASKEKKANLLEFARHTNLEAYKAYVAEETKKENLELSGCQMSYDQTSINCGDKVYKIDGSVDLSSRVNRKADMDSAPRPAPRSLGEKGSRQ